MDFQDRIRIIVEAEVERAVANLQRAQREVRATSSNFQRSSREISSGIPSMSAGLAALGVSVASAGAAIAVFSKQAFDMAASIQASSQVVNRLFGDNAQDVRDFASSVEESLGISEEAALRYSGVYGNLLAGFVQDSDTLESKTIEMLQQSAVIAAATGRTIEDVNERIRSGLLGNTEAIEDLGINVNVALIETTDAFKRFAGDKSWEKLDFNMQQQIRLAAILEQSYQKYGDSINQNVISEINKTTATFKNFQAEIGKAMVPIIQDILPSIRQELTTIREKHLEDIIKGVIVVAESLKWVWNWTGAIVDGFKSIQGALIGNLMRPFATFMETIANMHLPVLDDDTQDKLKEFAKSIRSLSTEHLNMSEMSSISLSENLNQMQDNIIKIYDTLSGKNKEFIEEVNSTGNTIQFKTPETQEIVDEKWLQEQQEILLQFEIDYRETLGRNEEAAKLSIEAQKEIYEQAGVDRVRLEEWADMQILRSKTDLFSGIKRGFHDSALESSDFASQAESLLSNAFSGAEDALVDFVTTGTADFKAFADSIISEIARMAIKMAIISPLQNALSGLFGNPTVSGVGAKVAHSGGMVDSVSSRRSVPTYLFAGAQRYHNGGMIGADEVPIIAQKGERVLNREETKEYNSGRGVSVNVIVNNTSGEKVDVKQQNNNQGGVDLEILIGDIAAKQASKKGSALSNAIKTANKQHLLRR